MNDHASNLKSGSPFRDYPFFSALLILLLLLLIALIFCCYNSKKVVCDCNTVVRIASDHHNSCCSMVIDEDLSTFSASQYEMVDAATFTGLRSMYEDYADSKKDEIRGINIPSSLICALYYQYCTIDEMSKPGYRVYYGLRPGSALTDSIFFGGIYPLKTDGIHLETPTASTTYLSVNLSNDRSFSGPCPYHCYGE